ncbi:MAG: VWA domain-containing protein [Proteobacteria bacterium]|nr:VWA domain-containing protein [Pseudomonadota bacterium]
MIARIVFALAVTLAAAWLAVHYASGVDFTHPYLLLVALAAIPAAWWSFRGTGRVAFSSLRVLPASGSTWRTRLAWLPDAMMALAIVALAIALAGPRRGDANSRIRREGIAVMMAIDVSGSMRALDLGGREEDTRLDAVKKVFERFVLGGRGLGGRGDDAIGLVAFARYADTRSPLTLDHGNLVTAARQLDFAPREEDGTAIGAGLALAVARLTEFSAKTRIAILLTDGVSNYHEIDEDAAIDEAARKGIKVYTIGAGTTGVAPMRIDRGDGHAQLVHVPVEIDETTLRKIADKTGGRYFRATDSDGLEKIYATIDALERTKIEETRFTQYHEYFDRFVGLALGLVTLALLLRASILRRLP